jgi:hypothetical protein
MKVLSFIFAMVLLTTAAVAHEWYEPGARGQGDA